MKYQALRGTKDILPDETPLWQYVEKTIQNVFRNFGFSEIRTPVIEQTELFTRTIGDSTDIVLKEMYSFNDKKGRNISLRPEETASVVRAGIENNLLSKDKIAKLYYIGPMFRYERPQAGRYRQFNQAGIEFFGSSSPYADAEVILAAIELFKALGLKGLEVDINSVGCKDCRERYVEELKKFLKENKSKLCKDCWERTEKNPMRVLDCKDEECKKILIKSPALKDFICKDCKDHLETVINILRSVGVSVKTRDDLVRGLDYYTKTTFEIISGELGAQNAICGGGRYDNLVKELGGSDVPAVGMAIGLERLIEVMRKQGVKESRSQGVKVFIACVGREAQRKAFEVLNELRKSGISSESSFLEKSLKSQLKTSDDLKAEFTLIIGDEELKKGSYPLKNMKTGEQKDIKLEDLKEELK